VSSAPFGYDPPGRARTIEITVSVEMNRRGAWELAVSDEHTRIVCVTLVDALRQARSIAGTRPSELIIRDAYHRLLEYERLGISCRHHG
jgi:hypothetical protein